LILRRVMRDARAWPIAHRWKFLAIFVRAWKLPDSLYSRCSAPWTACIFPQWKSRRTSYGNCLKQMLIMQKLFWALDQPAGRVDRRAMLRDTLHALDQLPTACAQFRKRLPARALPTLQQLEGSILKKLSPKEAYNMVPGRDPGIG